MKEEKINKKANICWLLHSLHKMEATHAALEIRRRSIAWVWFFPVPGPEQTWKQIPKLHCSSNLHGATFWSSLTPTKDSPNVHILQIYSLNVWLSDFYQLPSKLLLHAHVKKVSLAFWYKWSSNRRENTCLVYLLPLMDDLLFWIYYDANIGGECFIYLYA